MEKEGINMFNDIGINRDPFCADKVYYHKIYNRFFQLKKVHDDFLELSGLCIFYSDAMTNLQRSRVSYEFLKDAVLVNEIDKIAMHDGVGWRVKEKPVSQS